MKILSLKTFTFITCLTVIFSAHIISAKSCIADINVETIDCLPVGQCQPISIDLGTIECQSVNIFVNNTFYGSALYPSAQGISLTNITARQNSNIDNIRVCSDRDPNCCAEFEYVSPECETQEECLLRDVVIDYACLHGSRYFTTFSIVTDDPTGRYSLIIDGGNSLLITPSLGEIRIGPFPNGSTHTYTIVDRQNPDCFLEGEFFTQKCTPEACQGFLLEIDSIACNTDSTYNVDFLFDLTSSINDSVDVYQNGEFIDEFINDGSISLLNVIPGENFRDFFEICLHDNPNCCVSKSFEKPTCFIQEDCSIEQTWISYHCMIDESYTARIYFETQNTSNLHNLFLDGQFQETTQNKSFLFGPFENGTTHTYKIVDSVNPNCSLEVDLFTSDCQQEGPCMVDSIEVDSFTCNVDGTYNMAALFSSNNNFFNEVSISVNGDFFGIYHGVVAKLDNISPSENSDFDIIEICRNDTVNCCKILEYFPPDCSKQAACSLEESSVEYECRSDGEYLAYISIFPTDSTSLYRLSIDGQFLQMAQANANFIEVGPYDNGTAHVYSFVDVQNPDCVHEREFFTQLCLTDSLTCPDILLKVDSFTCNNDGTYNLSLIRRTDSVQNSNLMFSVNGEEFSRFTQPWFLSQRVTINPNPNSSRDFIELCIDEGQECCETIEFDQPECLNNDACAISEIALLYERCESDQYTLAARLYGDRVEQVDIFVDDELVNSVNMILFNNQLAPSSIGVYNLDEFHTIKVVSQADSTCFLEKEFGISNCEEANPAFNTNITLETIECNDDGTFNLDILHDFSDFGFDCIDLQIQEVNATNGTLGNSIFANYYVESSNINLTDISLNLTGEEFQITISVIGSDNASKILFFTLPDCAGEFTSCNIDFIEILGSTCNDNNTFNMEVLYATQNANTDFIDVFLNGDFFNTFENDSLVTLENIPFSLSTEIKTITICADDNPSCCLSIDYNQPDCNPSNTPCSIEINNALGICYAVLSDHDQLFLKLDASSDLNGHLVFVNGQLVLETDLLNQFTDLGPIEQSPNDLYLIEVVSSNDPTCTASFEIMHAPCSMPCKLSNLNVDIICDDTTGAFIPSLTFDFDFSYTTIVVVVVNGIQYGYYDPTQQPILLDALPNNSTQTWEFTVFDDYYCEITTSVDDISCGGECVIADFNVDVECMNNGEVLFHVDFFENSTSGQVNIVGNGNQYGSFDIENLPIVLGPFDPNENDIWEFIVSDVMNDNCQAIIEIESTECIDITDVECLVEDIEVFNIDCSNENEYSISLDFEAAINTDIPFSFFLNGIFMIETNTSSLPLNLNGLFPNDSSNIETITICLEELNDCCFDFTYETPSCITNSVDATLLEGVSLSPNPTRDIININHIPNEVIGLNIIDNHGKSILQLNGQRDIQIDVSDYPEGIYMAQFFTTDNRVISKRFIKMN